MTLKCTISALIIALVAACASPVRDTNKGARLSKFGPPDLFAKPIEDVDIIAALSDGKSTGEKLRGAAFTREFDNQLRSHKADRVTRNRIQDRLILASNELCENYKVLLKKKQSRFNFFSGAAATLVGAAGGVATGSDGPQLLSALSGSISGVRAEYNGQYFSDLAAHVITKGISARRKEILAAIELGRRKEPADYTVEMAIADAIVYHGACSLVGGLEQADSTLSKFQNFVGLDALGANPAFVPAKRPDDNANAGDKGKAGDPAKPVDPAKPADPGKPNAGGDGAGPSPPPAPTALEAAAPMEPTGESKAPQESGPPPGEVQPPGG